MASSSERVCTSCKEDGISNEGYSYCYNCDSLFCVTCDRVHRKCASSHKVVIGDAIPGTEEKQEFEPCKVHPKESLEHYCKDHELVLCVICKQIKHSKCHIESLSTAFQTTNVSEKLSEIYEQVSNLRERTQSIKTDKHELLEQSSKAKNEMKERINQIRYGLTGVLDRYDDQLTSSHLSVVGDATRTIKTCECLITELESQMDRLEKAKGNQIKEMVTLAESKPIYLEYQRVIDNILEETATPKIYIKEDDMLPDLIQKITCFGQRETVDSEEVVEQNIEKQITNKAFLEINSCSFEQKLDVNMPNDTRWPVITGCCFLPDETIMICDNPNQKVIIVDKTMKVRFTLLCTDNPQDVACLDESSVVVLSTSSNILQFVDYKPGFKLTAKKYMKHSLKGIYVHNKQLFGIGTKCESKADVVMIFTKTGDYVGFIPLVVAGLHWPQYFCLNSDGSNIYYIGSSHNCRLVNCQSKDGYGIYSVCSTALGNTTSIVSDTEGNLIVYDPHTKSIRLIDSRGIVGRTLLTEKDDFEPTSMCINASRDTLIVASCKKEASRLIVYKLDYN